MPSAVVHGEANLGYRRVAIVLGDSSPCVPEGIDAIQFIVRYFQESAHVLYAGVCVGSEAVTVRISLVKVEKEGSSSSALYLSNSGCMIGSTLISI